jgi:hypothetical protein
VESIVNLRTLVIVGSLAGLVAGCGSSSKDPAGPASALALCQGIGSTLASREVACSGGGIPESYMNLELAVVLNCENFQDAQAAGRVGFDQAKAKACLDTLAASSCGLLLRGGSLPSACYEAVPPQVAAGGTCTSSLDLECVAGFCDTSAAAACTTGGHCITSATLGQACSSTLRCARGLTCNASSTCEAVAAVTLVGLGGDCSASATTACDDGLYCNNAVTPRVCAAWKGAGESCTGAPCQLGLHCDPVSHTCATLVALGATCVPGQGQCAGNAYCSPTNKCVVTPTLGGDCSPSAGEALFCIDSWCKPPVAPATAPTCAPYAAPGAACDTGNLLQCGLGHACTPVTGTTGVCGRNYCGPI